MIFSFVVTQAFCLLGIVYGRLEAAVGRYAGMMSALEPLSPVLTRGLIIAERLASSISTQQLMSFALQRAVHR
jgi:hypothetical protein